MLFFLTTLLVGVDVEDEAQAKIPAPRLTFLLHGETNWG